VYVMNQLGRILHRTFARQASRAPNPGMKRRIKQETETANDQTPDTYEHAESDFLQVHQMHRQFGNETEEHKEKIKSLIVRNKYFNVKFPNMLTWSEKEQIRYLHSTDKEEWTVARLADSFPADEFTIKKIIKSKWNPADQARVAKHDDLVNKNWELLQDGKLYLEPNLQEHLKKFSNRQLNHLPNFTPPVKSKVDLFKPTSTEFVSIIQSSKNTKKPINPTKMLTSRVDEMNWKAPKKDMFVMPGVENSRPLTYRELDLPETAERTELSMDDTSSTGDIMFRKLSSNVSDKNVIARIEEVDLKPFCQPDAIRENITIPKKYWKRGGTYKIDDCYYDDDGELLYRVPGMK
jgi:neugrin